MTITDATFQRAQSNGTVLSERPDVQRDELSKMLGVSEIGRTVVGVQMYGRGPAASVDVRLSGDITLTFERFSDITRGPTLTAYLGERRNTLLVLGETGVFVISATYAPGHWDDVVTVHKLAQKIRVLLPGYDGPVQAAICHPFTSAAPRLWHRPDDQGNWIAAWGARRRPRDRLA